MPTSPIRSRPLALCAERASRLGSRTSATTGGRPPARKLRRAYDSGNLSRDGKRLAVGVLDAGRLLIRVLDLDQAKDGDPLDLPGSNWAPVWHPDGKHLAYLSLRKGDFDAYWKDLTASAAPEPLLATAFDDTPPEEAAKFLREIKI